MTALFIAPRVPVVDPRTGLANPIWYRFFEGLFSNNGVGSVADASGFEVAPSVLASDLAAFVVPFDDVSPVPADALPFPDDMSPAITALAAEVAYLRSQIDDLRKGTVTL